VPHQLGFTEAWPKQKSCSQVSKAVTGREAGSGAKRLWAVVQGGYGQWSRAVMDSGTWRLEAVGQGGYRSDAGWSRAGKQTVVQGLPRQAGLGQTGLFWQRLHGLCRRSRSPAASLQLLVSLQNLQAQKDNMSRRVRLSLLQQQIGTV